MTFGEDACTRSSMSVERAVSICSLNFHRDEAIGSELSSAAAPALGGSEDGASAPPVGTARSFFGVRTAMSGAR